MANIPAISTAQPDTGGPGRLPLLSIRNQLRYGVTLLVILSVLGTGGLMIMLSSNTQSQQLERMLQARSEATATRLAAYMDDLLGRLSYLARVRGLTDATVEVQHNLLQALTRHNDAYELVALVDSTGVVRASVAPYGAALPQQLTESPAFAAAYQRGEEFVGPVELAQIENGRHLPIVTLAVPVRDRQDEVAGALVARVNLEFLWFIVAEAGVGETGYAYVLDNRNVLVTRTGAEMETFEPEPVGDRPFIQQLLSDQIAPGKPYEGLQGVEVLGARSRVPSMSWNVVVELPTAEAYAPIRSMMYTTGGLLAVVVLVGALVGLFFAHQIVGPLSRLTSAAAELSAGKLDLEVPVRSRNELGVLATTFNAMVGQLRSLIETLRGEQNFVSSILDSSGALMLVLDPQGRIVRLNKPYEQLIGTDTAAVSGKYVWELFDDPQAVQHTQELIKQLRASQQSVEDESLWHTPDGTQRVIAWSYRLLHVQEGDLQYMIGSGLDVTEVREAERARARLQEDIIRAQAEILSDLSTPLIPLTETVVLMPLIGAVDSQRAQQMLDVLLRGVEKQKARTAIIDITGVPTVDTQVAGILVRAAQAVQLLGATTIITGINPEIAETLVTLGAGLKDIVTTSNLHHGLDLALGTAGEQNQRHARNSFTADNLIGAAPNGSSIKRG